MASASAGLELPATSLIAPLLPAIPALLRGRRPSPIPKGGYPFSEKIMLQRKLAPDTSRLPSWQYESKSCPRSFFQPQKVVSGLANGEPAVLAAYYSPVSAI